MDDDSLSELGRKKFSDETVKKIKWVRNMFCQWREDRNATGIDHILCDLENISNITVAIFVFAMTRFITEIR